MPSSHWLIKPKNISLFLYSSVMVIVGGTLLLFLRLADATTITTLEKSSLFQIFAGIVGVVAAPSAIYVFVGMLWYWAAIDNSARLVKTVWFVLFILTGFLALAFYSLVVYRRQVTAPGAS